MGNKDKYYLINGKIMKGGEMPEIDNFPSTTSYIGAYEDWIESIQLCEISEIELDKVKEYLRSKYDLSPSDTIDVTDIVEEKLIWIEKDLKSVEQIIFKQPKAKEDSEAVLIQAIKSVLYESAKKTEIPEGGFKLSVQFEDQAKELIKQFNISLRNI